MKNEEMTITVTQAKEWLVTKANNRTLNKRHIDYLANEMRQGNWRLTHQGVAFNEKGELIDAEQYTLTREARD